jgi:hypothetical protein
MNDISDDEYENVVNPCHQIIINYIKTTFLNDFIAYNLATCYSMDAMWSENFDLLIYSALEELTQLNLKDCNKYKIKKILEEKYKLKVINESPIDIKEI